MQVSLPCLSADSAADYKLVSCLHTRDTRIPGYSNDTKSTVDNDPYEEAMQRFAAGGIQQCVAAELAADSLLTLIKV